MKTVPATQPAKSSKPRAPSAQDLPDYAPVPRSALGPALNEQGFYVGRVERNLYWITDGVYQSAFLTTRDGVVLLDAPPTIGRNIQRGFPIVAFSPPGFGWRVRPVHTLPARRARCHSMHAATLIR